MSCALSEVVEDVSGKYELALELFKMNLLRKAHSFSLKAIGHTIFKICLLLISLYYIVFVNTLILLMRKIGKEWL